MSNAVVYAAHRDAAVRRTYVLMAWLVLVGTSAVIAAVPGRDAWGAPSPDPAVAGPSRYQVPLGMLPPLGPTRAAITIVEWSDFSCRYCNVVRAQLRALATAYPLQIRWVYRQFPLDEDQTLLQEAAVAAAAQGAFWPMHDRLFAWRGRASRADLVALAGELGLDTVAFEQALEMRRYREEVLADFEDAIALGVSGTPAFFINGRPLFGNRPLDEFVDIIEQELRAVARLSGDIAPYEALMAIAARGPVAAGDGGRALAAGAARGAKAAAARDAKRYQLALAPPARRIGVTGQVGAADALTPSVELVLWSDLECPFCARQWPVVLAAAAAFPSDVAVSYRHFPLAMHAHAGLAAQAGEAAAAQGRFASYVTRVLAGSEAPTLPVLWKAAEAEGLDMVAFAAALAQGTFAAVVADDLAVARTLRLSGTPTLFINGVLFDGALADGPLRAAIEEARAHVLQARGMTRADAVMLETIDGVTSPLDDSARFVGARKPAAGVPRLRSLVSACHRGDVTAAAALLEGFKGSARDLAQWRAWCARAAGRVVP